MPKNLMPVVVTSSLGIGVLAGVVSGICYVFIQGFRSKRSLQSKYALTTPWQCCVCGKHFSHPSSSSSTSLTANRTVEEDQKEEEDCWALCKTCDGRACVVSCAKWDNKRHHWFCKQCLVLKNQNRKNQGWFKGLLTVFQPQAVSVRMSSSTPQFEIQNVSMDLSSEESSDEKEIVRDFIERLVEAMLGADLDTTSVQRIYSDPEYDAIFNRYHEDISATLTELGSALHISITNLPLTGQTPCTAHASLKNIIRRVLRDASNMAILKQPQNEAAPSEPATNRTYEDLLATAILNKVIDNYQSDLRRSSSGSASSSKRSRKSHEDNKSHCHSCTHTHNDPETASLSSVEEWCRSESSIGEKYVDHLSFTIQQSIEELTTSDEEQSNQQYLHSHNISKNSLHNSELEKDNYVREDWQDNWLFSRKGKRSPKPVPVPMLVPNPSTDYRALIGDRDAEDTTDLSETGSDVDEPDSSNDIKTLLVDSRTVIGGKNLLDNVNIAYQEEKQKEVEADNRVIVNNSIQDQISEAKNNKLINEQIYEESDSLESNTEKDAEYTEKYASFPRPITKKKTTSVLKTADSEKIEIENDVNQSLLNGEEAEESEKEMEEPPMNLRGSYSEKERQKWLNPVALKNNPYSKENLDKRLKNTSHVDTFGRDYYIREAKKAAGGRKKFANDDIYSENSRHDFEEESMSVIEEIKESEESIFTAIPAIVNSEETLDRKDEKLDFESISASRPNSLALSTDSDDTDVKKVYNVESGNIYVIKDNNFTKEIIQNSKNPEGVKRFTKPDSVISYDEVNNNKQLESTKTPIMNISTHIPALSAEKIFKNVTKQENTPEPKTLQTCEVKITPELKETTKKYLQSLTRTNSKTNNNLELNKLSTPPISLQEIQNISENERNNSEIEYIVNKEPKNCIDLRFIPKNRLLSPQPDRLINNSAYKLGFANSSPCIFDDSFLLEPEEKINEQKLSVVTELNELNNIQKPKVSDLKKLFDQPTKTNLARAKSYATLNQDSIVQRQIHSLTARTLSKEFRKDILPELQKSSLANSDEDVISENNKDDEELKSIPTCKSKIEFFELLRNN